LAGNTSQWVHLALAPEFGLLRDMLKARNEAGLSQADVAERMGTKSPAITRLESSLTSGRHSPSITTLKKYAEAVGCTLEIKLIHCFSIILTQWEIVLIILYSPLLLWVKIFKEPSSGHGVHKVIEFKNPPLSPFS
jgi:transcriptional regulator with XRE-family HTH domain